MILLTLPNAGVSLAGDNRRMTRAVEAGGRRYQPGEL